MSMKIIEVVEHTPLTREEAYVEDSIRREIQSIDTIINNSSTACYKQANLFMSFFFAAYVTFVAAYISCCCFACPPNLAITIVSWAAFILVAILNLILHYRLYKRQSIYRKIKETLEDMYENVFKNIPITNGEICFSTLQVITSDLREQISKSWFRNLENRWKKLWKEFYYLALVFALIMVTFIIIIITNYVI